MRGKVIRCEELARVVGITPACAGKSCRSPQGRAEHGITPRMRRKDPELKTGNVHSRDYPRVCGEKGRG